MTFKTPPVPQVSGFEVIPGSPTTVREERYIPKLLSSEDEAQILLEVGAWELAYHGDDLPKGWSVRIHPEGNRYFVFCLGHGRNMITHANLLDLRLKESIESVRELVFSKFSKKDLPANIDIVFDNIAEPDGVPTWVYYAACWDRRVIFWPESVDSDYLTEGSRNTYSLGLASEWQFWIHVEICPCHRMLPDGSIAELKRSLQHLIVGELLCHYFKIWVLHVTLFFVRLGYIFEGLENVWRFEWFGVA
ncbi:hypothetical protein NLI96_g812 [Meripilus lineatus]|uniref:Uncharacterized protein n=1 Tax=Meripilus lineatus TaxID=2056292 RepID=A0AAD5YIZ3_9APHY|nr:hypothetical protein NLI96_g812 [Physisporinus lineatus]